MRRQAAPASDHATDHRRSQAEDRGFLATIGGDGLLPLLAVAGALVFSGTFLILLGFGGQFVMVDPASDTVVVRLGGGDEAANMQQVTRIITEALVEE